MQGPTQRTRKNPYAKAITAYYQALKEFEFQHALHEGAVRAAFQALLADAARSHKWTLIPELGDKQTGKTIRPDGTLKDFMNLVRGHWEAKDTADDLDNEIAKKRAIGYPVRNIIFEDTRTAVLMQNGEETLRVDLKDAAKLATLLETFFGYREPQIESFEKAITDFQVRVPELALALKDKIADAHKKNQKFNAAYARFFDLCANSLNPNITRDAVDDMLVQHLLTERLIREVFEDEKFSRRNVIADEIEKVIDALTLRAFHRADFLRQLDRFYVAIENAARTMPEFNDKQHFLNTIYERFFQGYSVKLADTMGIVYTPQPIVDFMCASVAEVLEKEFGRSLGDKDVNILDPCTGTGNFIVNLMKRIPKRDLPRMYRQQMFANEIMLMPYYIAAMNIEHAYYELTGEYESFEGLCFVDTLDLAESHQTQLGFMTAKNSERVERQKRTPITVVIGNPPYNMGQQNENDNNKNRKYDLIDRRIAETFVEGSSSTLRTKLYDAYVRFFRWSFDRLENRSGIVCMVSNNGFLRGIAFDQFRRRVAADFDLVYHVDLKGNARTSGEARRQEGGNVFNDLIRTGIGITLFVRLPSSHGHAVKYYEAADYMSAEAKQELLVKLGSVDGVAWVRCKPDTHGNWIDTDASGEFDSLVPLGSKEARRTTISTGVLFHTYSPGVNTARDSTVYGHGNHALVERMGAFAELYNAEVDRYVRLAPQAEKLDSFLDYSRIKWSRNLKRSVQQREYLKFSQDHVRTALYRPFSRKWLYFADLAIDELGKFPRIFPKGKSNENAVMCAPGAGSTKSFSCLVSSCVCDFHTTGDTQCFPFYVYDEDGSNRRENITDWALEQFRSHYKDKKISKWDIFHYVYGLLHHPGYRTKFADNLKRELPRIPFAPDFKAFRGAGQSLAGLHLDYEKLKPWKLKWIETPGVPLSYRVEKMKLVKPKVSNSTSDTPSPQPSPGGRGSKAQPSPQPCAAVPGEGAKLIVNESLTLGEIPAEVFDYRLGNRSALEWVIDQYQVCTDKRSGITSDPNRDDDPEYIVRLVGQVVRVSLETVKLVANLPKKFS